MAAVLLPSKIKRQKIMDTAIQTNKTSRRRVSDVDKPATLRIFV